ncbi:MAG: NAD-dependent epimerase/dehydratase family protein [Bacteroidales bacterium]
MQRILVTGAGGFIGGFIVEEALNRGFETYAGVRKSTSREYLSDSRIQFIDLPFHNRGALARKLQECRDQFGGWDYIIHNLGATKVKKTEDFDKINYEFARNFVETLIELNMQPKQFLYISTLGVLGPGNESTSDPITHQNASGPNTAYGRSKQKMEIYLKSLTDFNYVIIRPTGVYGPREKDYFLMFKTIKSGFNFIPGFKEQYLTFIYVKDLVKALFLCIDKEICRKEYNLSDGQCYTSSLFCNIVKHRLNKQRVVNIKLPLILVRGVSIVAENIAKIAGKTSTLNGDKYRIMKQRNWNCDISDLKKDTGFHADYDLKRGVEEAISWYEENQWL